MDNNIRNNDWFLEPIPMYNFPGTPLNVIQERKNQRLVEVKLSRHTYYYIQELCTIPSTGEKYWENKHYDRSKNKMIRRFNGI